MNEHLADRVAEHQARQAERRRERTELQAAREAGLSHRHSTKLAHLTANGDADTHQQPQSTQNPT